MLALLISLLIVAPGAQGAPRPLMQLGEHEQVALAGDRVLFTSTHANKLEVRALPLAGGSPQTLFTVTAPPGRRTPNHVLLTASAQRAVLFVAYGLSRDAKWEQTQIFAGTPTGGWSAVAPMGDKDHLPLASTASLEDDQIIAVEQARRDQVNDYDVVTYDPARKVLDIPEGARLAGDLVAYSEGFTSDLGVHMQRLIVLNRRTGARVTSDDMVGDPPVEVGLRPDGLVVLRRGVTIYMVAPGGEHRKVADNATFPIFSGDRLVFARQDGLRVREPNGRIRAFGIPTRDPDPPLADAGNVLWRANGCVLVAAITDPPAGEPGPGPCARSEFAVVAGDYKSGRLRVRCIAGPASGCEGTVQLRANRRAASASKKVRIAPGKSQVVRLRVTRAAKRLEAGELDVQVTQPGGQRRIIA